MKTIELKIKIPNWANWIAQDEDGVWWAFEEQPSRMHNHWMSFCGTYCALTHAVGADDPKWVYTLRWVG